MKAPTYKHCIKSIFLALLLMSSFSGVAFAEAQIFGLSCPGGTVTGVTDNSFVCSESDQNVYVDEVGQQSPSAETDQLTIIKVECGSHKIVDPPKAGVVNTLKFFTCTSGGKPTLSVIKTIDADPNGATPPGRAADTSQNDCTSSATCVDAQCDSASCTDRAADPNADCSKDEGCNIVLKYINPAIRLFTVIFGIAAVISLILGGIQYSSSGGDPQKVSSAKNRIVKTIIAIVGYAFLAGLFRFIVPGGI